MPIPVLKQGNLLIAELAELSDTLAARIGRERSKGVIIDVTVLDVLDSFASRTLLGIAQTTKLRGAEMVLVGLQPDVAFAMVQLGLTLDGIVTALDFEEGLDLLTRSSREGIRRGA
jgi:rsbT antagonist protein RsbS